MLAAGSIVLAAIAAVYGEDKSAPAAPPASAGLINDFLRQQSDALTPWDFGGQFRARFEHKENFAAAGQAGAIDFRAKKGDPDNTYLLLREKLHAGYSPASWLTVYAEARDSSSQNDDRNPNPDSDTFDLHQAYLQLGDAKQFPLVLKVGRQELSYGDERLIGTADWSNVPRSFDAAKLRFENTTFWLDAFYSRPVIPDDNNFNVSNDYDAFSGVYGGTRALIPKTETQLYFLARNTELGSPTLQKGALVGLPSPRDIYTAGGRIKSLPGKFSGWDFEAEGAYQFGRFKTTAVSKSLNQDAFALHGSAGYTFAEAAGTPRLGIEYNFGSGDKNAADGTHGTFENLFPTNHKFYGYMDFISWQNINDLRFNASIKPVKGMTLNADYHAFWLADTHDAFYTVAGAPRTGGGVGTGTGYAINPGYNNYLGSEVDLVANYLVTPWAGLQAGFGHFFVGNYIKSSLSAPAFGATDANWLYAQLTLNF